MPLERLLALYVEQHNTVAPHSAFAGQTPDENVPRPGRL